MGMCLCKDEVEDQNVSLQEKFDLLFDELLETFKTDILDCESGHSDSMVPCNSEQYEMHPLVWIEMIKALISILPIENPIVFNVMKCFLSHFQLPAEYSVSFMENIIANSQRLTLREERNICVILACLVERLDGSSCDTVLTKTTVKYLLGNLEEGAYPDVMLFSFIALEKFAQKIEIDPSRHLSKFSEKLLTRLERHSSSKNCELKQVGFCAKWCLDNYFVIEGRKHSYENIKVTLNMEDVSDYLKISADGLEARCDTFSFESVRCTYKVNSGCWYYECTVMTPGVMQIGWTTQDDPNYLKHESRGIGDDQHSISFDGCRRVIFYDNKSQSYDLPMWFGGSIVGCILDFDAREVIFSLNGIEGDALKQLFDSARDGFYAAASFCLFQQCRFNFGAEPFRYPPKNRAFDNFNGHSILKIFKERSV